MLWEGGLPGCGDLFACLMPLTAKKQAVFTPLPATRVTAPCPVQLLVDQLRQKCLEEPRTDDRPRGYSALTQDPKECIQEVGGWGGWLGG
jgi:hypothetical protein